MKRRNQEILAAVLALLTTLLILLSVRGQNLVARRPLYADFQPWTLSSAKSWYEADSGAYNDAGSTLATDGQSVQQWNDRTTNARNVSQATSGARPIWRATGGPNSKPALEWDGTDDSLSGASNGLSAAPHSVWIVAMTTSSTGTHRILYDNAYQWGKQALKFRFTISGVQDYNSTADQWATNTWAIFLLEFDTGFDATIYKNGSSIETVLGSADTSGNSNFRVGSGPGTEFWTGKIAVVGEFNEIMSSDNKTSMWTYLNTKYVVF